MDYSLHFACRHYSICNFGLQYAELTLTAPDGLAVNEYRNHPGHSFCNPECIPDSCRTKSSAKKESSGDNDHHIAEQGDNERRGSLSQAFQGAAGGDG